MTAVEAVPVVDLRDWAQGGEPRRRLVRAVGESLTAIGFFAVRHQGVPDAVTRRAYEVAQALFHLDAVVQPRPR